MLLPKDEVDMCRDDAADGTREVEDEKPPFRTPFATVFLTAPLMGFVVGGAGGFCRIGSPPRSINVLRCLGAGSGNPRGLCFCAAPWFVGGGIIALELLEDWDISIKPFVDGDRGGIFEGGRSPEARIDAFSFNSMADKARMGGRVQERESRLHWGF